MMQKIMKSIFVGFGKQDGTAAAANILYKAIQKTDGIPMNESQGVDKCFELGYNSVRQATTKVMKVFNNEGTVSNRFDLLGQWHKLVQHSISQDICRHYPEHSFICGNKQRQDSTLGEQPTWVLDPIAGDENLAHGFPAAAISLSFWVDGKPEFGIISNMLLDEIYTTRAGYGAYLNEVPISVNKQCKLSQALVLHDLSTSTEFCHDQMNHIQSILSASQGVRSLGSTTVSMCMVARGMADAYVGYDCHALDVAAAILLVKQAGGVVLDHSLKNFDLMSRGVLCASSLQLAEQLLTLLLSKPPSTDDQESNKPKQAPKMANTYAEENHVVSVEENIEESAQATPCLDSVVTKLKPPRAVKDYKGPTKRITVFREDSEGSPAFSSYSGCLRKEKASSSREKAEHFPTDPLLPGQGSLL